MKRLLLDTHMVLWWLQGSDRFKDSIVVLLKDARNEVFVSAASVWEIAIKQSLGKLEAPDDLLDLMERSGFCLLYTSPSPRDKRQSRMPSSA